MAYKSTPLDNMLALRLLLMLTTPFKEFPAYKLGVINDKGDYIVPPNKRTPEQKKNLTYLDKLMINVKKLLNKYGGESKLKNLMTAMFLIKEGLENQTDFDGWDGFAPLTEAIESGNCDLSYRTAVLEAITEFQKIKECVGTGAIGASGNVASNNTTGIAGYDGLLFLDIQRRKRNIR